MSAKRLTLSEIEQLREDWAIATDRCNGNRASDQREVLDAIAAHLSELLARAAELERVRELLKERHEQIARMGSENDELRRRAREVEIQNQELGAKAREMLAPPAEPPKDTHACPICKAQTMCPECATRLTEAELRDIADKARSALPPDPRDFGRIGYIEFARLVADRQWEKCVYEPMSINDIKVTLNAPTCPGGHDCGGACVPTATVEAATSGHDVPVTDRMVETVGKLIPKATPAEVTTEHLNRIVERLGLGALPMTDGWKIIVEGKADIRAALGRQAKAHAAELRESNKRAEALIDEADRTARLHAAEMGHARAEIMALELTAKNWKNNWGKAARDRDELRVLASEVRALVDEEIAAHRRTAAQLKATRRLLGLG
jgi:hypothetical protein